ncbi:hypothetical protein QQP08_010925 [Theobroma cacao]|nr:hypothetical protein QQP08_010925 [Theobroma cacao]
MKKVIELTKQADTKGIQIQIAKRIDEKEIALVEWIREAIAGRVSNSWATWAQHIRLHDIDNLIV